MLQAGGDIGLPRGQHVGVEERLAEPHERVREIARCGADGRWRYIVDNPYGTRFREQM